MQVIEAPNNLTAVVDDRGLIKLASVSPDFIDEGAPGQVLQEKIVHKSAALPCDIAAPVGDYVGAV